MLIKRCVRLKKNTAYFPDAQTERRGRKTYQREMISLPRKMEWGAWLYFVVILQMRNVVRS